MAIEIKERTSTELELQIACALKVLEDGYSGNWDGKALETWILENLDIIAGGWGYQNTIYLKFKTTDEARKAVSRLLEIAEKSKNRYGDERYWHKTKDGVMLLQFIWN